MLPRNSGILLHPTSLPGRFGIGDLGDNAYGFADFLAGARQHLWQMLPLGPTGYGNSPYQCLSAFAGNPTIISLDGLVADGLLDPASLANLPEFSRTAVDFDAVAWFKTPVLRKSFDFFVQQSDPELHRQFASFCEQNAFWLEDFSLFMALKEAHSLTSWNTWDDEIRRREPSSVARWKARLEREVRFHQYEQFIFFKQWSQLRKYCAERGIRLIGDIPIFVALDSAEVWAHPEIFFLDDAGRPTVVAGVPPDYFSKTGQLWGNPLYRWDIMAEDGYRWWIDRFRATRAFVDIIRLDHFRGFEKYWEIPAKDETAINGRWVDGPGEDFFDAVMKSLGELSIIAEDLGVITPEVVRLRDRWDFPGMRVLQFAFLSGSADDWHLPHNYPRNCVVYTGTHDNNTTIGWFHGDDAGSTTLSNEAREQEKRRALKYLATSGAEVNWDMIRLAWASVANTAIVPLQDVLGLGSEARMNTPGTKSGNWKWRFTADLLTDDIKARLSELTELYGR